MDIEWGKKHLQVVVGKSLELALSYQHDGRLALSWEP